METKTERCKDTIGLEEYIAMKNQEQHTHVKAEVTYKSGRTETVYGKLNKDQLPDKTFQRKLLSALRQFPTVTDIKTTKYTQ